MVTFTASQPLQVSCFLKQGRHLGASPRPRRPGTQRPQPSNGPGRTWCDAQQVPVTGQGARPDARGPSDLEPGTVLGGRYEVLAVLGRGGNGVTYRCLDTDTSAVVAVKALSLRSLRDWKQLELFQREAQILENLDHPGIPRYIDAFEEDTDTDRSFFLVQQLAAGRSLEDLVSSGWRADEAECRRIAVELLKILQYLGSRRPPVTHRDVKPSNIVVEGGRAGGRVFLVDFGGVQAAAAAGDLPGSTVVGTYGFMAPEQFRGAAQPASDLYGLGGTLLYLLSGRPPSAFPVDRMRLDLSNVAMSRQLRAVVEGLLEPVLEDRLSATEAAALLEGKRRPAARVGGAAFPRTQQQQQQQRRRVQESPAFMDVRPAGGVVALRKPAGSRIKVTKRGPRLEIDIPPGKFDGNSAATGAFAIAWNAFVAFWTVSALAGGGVLFALFSLPFWAAGASLAKQAFGRQFVREHLEISLSKWKLQQQVALARGSEPDWDKGGGKELSGRTTDLSGAAMQVMAYVNGQPQGQLVLREGVESFSFGEGLDPLEQEWLASVINAHLAEVAAIQGEIEGFEGEEEGEEGGSTGIPYNDFAEFDSRLGEKEAAAAVRAGQEAATQARRAGESAAAQASQFAEQAAAEAAQFADQAMRSVERATRSAAPPQRPQRSDSSSTIDLGSADFDVLDD